MLEVTVAQLKEMLGTVSVIDVREPGEFADGHVPGALLMPLSTIPLRVSEIDRDETHYLICEAGGRSAQACAFLAAQGFDVVNVGGGTGMWRALGYDVTTGDRP